MFLVFGLGQEHVKRLFGGVDPGNERSEICFRKGGASGGGLRSSTTPDVEEDRAASSRHDLRGGIVGNEKLERVGVITLSHLLLLFPSSRRIVIEDQVAVVAR